MPRLSFALVLVTYNRDSEKVKLPNLLQPHSRVSFVKPLVVASTAMVLNHSMPGVDVLRCTAPSSDRLTE